MSMASMPRRASSASSMSAASVDGASASGLEFIPPGAPESGDYDMLFKVLLVGDSAVGKTSIVRRFVDKYYDPTFISTIGVDFAIQTVRIDGAIVKLQIWDTAGQERFRSITSSYYRGAHGILMVYDVTDPDTLDSIDRVWMDESGRYARADVTRMLVANKADLADTTTEWGEREAAAALCEEHGMEYCRTSAKSGDNVEVMFAQFLRRLINNRGVGATKDEDALPDTREIKGRGVGRMFDCCKVA